jgi:hypothetical protein
MNKPIKMQLLEQFSKFLKDNGYELNISTDYDGLVKFQVQFPNGALLSEELSDFSSKEIYEFDYEAYDRYSQQAKLSGFSEREIEAAKQDFWMEKENE